MNRQDLLKAKEITQKKIDLNYTLLETIRVIKQDEENLQEEIRANKLILKLINKQIRENRG